MPDEVQPDGKKKRGRPKKDPNAPPKPPPACEKSELAKYPEPDKYVAWGLEPVHPGFKQKGVTLLYNPADKGGQVTIMPVKDEGDGLRWRYRKMPRGVPVPYRYEMIPLEPGELVSLWKKIGEFLQDVGWVDIKVADKTTEDFHAKVKDDTLSEKIKRNKVWG